MADEEVIRHNIKIRKDVHPTLYEELSKTKNDRASIQRLLALATLGLIAERVGMRPMEFHAGQQIKLEPTKGEIPAPPMQYENPKQPTQNTALDLLGNTSDLDDLHDVFEGAKS